MRGFIVELPILLRRPDLVCKRAAAGNNNNCPALIAFLNRVQAINQRVGAGQAATQFDNDHVMPTQQLNGKLLYRKLLQ